MENEIGSPFFYFYFSLFFSVCGSCVYPEGNAEISSAQLADEIKTDNGGRGRKQENYNNNKKITMEFAFLSL